MSPNPLLCYHCAAVIPSSNQGRQDTCENCGRDTRVCKNCKHYDRNYNNECREEQAARQVEKEKGNFCEWFQVREGGPNAPQGKTKQDLKSAADALFKKK